MKRKTKNIINGSVIVALLASMGVTYYFASKSLTTNMEMSQPNMSSNSTMNGSAPSMPENSGTQSDTNTPPEKPDGDTSTGSSSTNTPPEKPDGDTSTGSSDTNTPPEKPDGDTGNAPSGDSSTQPSMPDNGNSTNQMTPPSDNGSSNQSAPSMGTTSSLSTIYYVLFGVEAFLLGGAIVYLFISQFNLLTIGTVMHSAEKIIICVLSAILVCGGSIFLMNHFIGTNSSSMGAPSGNMGGTNTSSSATYSATSEVTSSTTLSDTTYTSDTADQNALLVSGDVTVGGSDLTVSKTGSSDGGDSTSFYGTNSAVLAKDGATLTLSGITVTTDATGANGVFSYGGSATTSNATGDGTTVNISDSTITTKQDNSGGIMTTGGGVMNATNLTVTTEGTSSAAIRSDRGGGTVSVDGGTYTTNGQGSPTVYSTANITVKNATLKATASEGIVIEGKNSVTLENVTLEDSNTKLNGQSTTYKNIFLYQSMSGDADTGTSSFSASDSTITTHKGDTFYVTNTTAEINLENNTITNDDSTGNFLRIQADSWGTSGSNGGDVTMNLTNQDVDGNIVVDSISTLTLTLKKSTYTGTLNGSNSAKSISLTLDKNSTITLTGDSYVTSLSDADTSYSNINLNGYTLYVNGVALTK